MLKNTDIQNDDNVLKFLEYLQFEKRYSKNTVIAYMNDIKQFVRYMKGIYGQCEWQGIGHIHIRSWMVDLVKNDITPRSINRKISTLRSFFNFLMRKKVLSKNPTLKIIPPKVGKRLPEYVHEKQIQNLFDTIELDDFEDRMNRMIIELIYSTGMRRSELINLTDQNIDYSNNMIKVLGKGNKERYIPISVQLTHKIKTWIGFRDDYFDKKQDAEYLFVTKKGRKLYPKAVYNMVKAYLSTVTTAEKKSPHILRHSFATHLMNEGADLNAVKELLGHSSLAATQVYTHNSIEKLKEIYKKAHPKSR